MKVKRSALQKLLFSRGIMTRYTFQEHFENTPVFHPRNGLEIPPREQEKGVDKSYYAGYNTGAHLRECWNGRQARLRCVWQPPCGFESHLSHQNIGHPVRGARYFYARDGTRKAVKKTCRWHVFRPWESPSDLRRIRYGCGSNLSISDVNECCYKRIFRNVI